MLPTGQLADGPGLSSLGPVQVATGRQALPPSPGQALATNPSLEVI